MTRVDFDPEGWAQARREIHAMRDRAMDYTAAWNEVIDWFAHQNRLHFGSRGKRWRTPWKELSPAYLYWKREEGWQGDILVRTSDLLRSLSDRPLGIERIGRLEMVAGTRVSYARFHQDGTKFMPARRLVNGPQVQAEGAVSSAVASWIVDGNARVTAGGMR